MSEPFEPTPPSATEADIQKQIQRSARSPLVQWLRSRGWKILLPLTAVVVVAGIVVGPVHGFDYIAGVRAPSDEIAVGYKYLSAVVLTAVGWLAVPATVGGIVGYVVSTQLAAFRAKTKADIINGDDK